jgi:Txe/YoeB family toxin of Txe-Axe toxin-antitoxin module
MELQLAIASHDNEDDERPSSDDEEKMTSSIKPSPAPTVHTLQAIETLEESARNEIYHVEEENRKKLSILSKKALHKLSPLKLLTKKERLHASIRENFIPQMAGASTPTEQKVMFTPEAYEQFQALDKTGKKRFYTLIQAIENGETTGNEERLKHAKLIDGKSVMTREMTKGDRLAYTHQNGIISVLSLEDHYND